MKSLITAIVLALAIAGCSTIGKVPLNDTTRQQIYDMAIRKPNMGT